VDVVDVEVVGVEPVERPLNLRPDVLAPQPRIVGTGLAAPVEREVHLRGDHVILALALREPLADVLLTFPVRRPVHVGGVDEVYPVVRRRVEEFVRLLAARLDDDAVRLSSEAPRPEAELGDVETRVTEPSVVHTQPTRSVGIKRRDPVSADRGTPDLMFKSIPRG